MRFLPGLFLAGCCALAVPSTATAQSSTATNDQVVRIADDFRTHVRPIMAELCFGCHDAETMESGIRVDHLDGSVRERHLRLWEVIRRQLAEGTMPPEGETQPSAPQRTVLIEWIDRALHMARSRPTERNGSVRRLTVEQYAHTLRDLLGVEENLTDVLPPDAVSKEGFTNNADSMVLSPLQVEAYLSIAERALDLCIVDERTPPSIQNFRVDLGRAINPEPCPDKLILGANSLLLANEDFVVHQLTADKPFAFDPFVMRTKYRFHEGYQGNATVRGWRDYDSIYHAVYACMRGNRGYPKGNAWETVPEGLLLRPAIPSAELFGVESTYGPRANFKIALRELPDHGRFRVTVTASRYDDGLLLEKGTVAREAVGRLGISGPFREPQSVEVAAAGVYQVDVHLAQESFADPDPSRLSEGLIGHWALDGDAAGGADEALTGDLTAGAQFVSSPFGQAVSVDGKSGAVVIPRHPSMDVGDGEFTVAAWIHPRQLRQGGIVCLGKYSWTHGWYLDMPNNRGVLRIETASPDNQSNGTVSSAPGMIKPKQWQHVAAVVRRGENQTHLFINGFKVATGTIAPRNLDNPAVDLHIGRIQDSRLFSGQIDEVRLYQRALSEAEIQALVEPGRRFAHAPAREQPGNLQLQLGARHFSGTLRRPAFLAVRLPAGPLDVVARSAGRTPVGHINLTPLEPNSAVARDFEAFEARDPRVGVHVGLRRDCGHTFAAVGRPQTVAGRGAQKFVFEGAIANYPSPDVQDDNDNYLAGVREIGIRSEFAVSRDMPRLCIRSVEFEGPLYETWPPATHQRIFFTSTCDPESAEYAAEVIRGFAERAWRRPVTDSEAERLLQVWREAMSETNDFQRSVRDALVVVLTSPAFLFLIENSATSDPEPLDPYELASKLSYFLWNTAPDERLLRLAASGTLEQSLDGEVSRLVADPRFEQFVSEFAEQWLQLDKFDVVEFDRKRFARLTRLAQAELRKEPSAQLLHLFRRNLPVRQLVQSETVVANDVVADYYGLTGAPETGFMFVPMRHNTEHLGGLLTQAAILGGLSDGRESNPVKRGAWLARKIIAEPPDDPPPNVPELEEDTSHLSLRERLERHRNQQGCVKCHEGIDPWGVPFEQFDAAGVLKNKPIDAESMLPDRTIVRDVNELKSYLADDRLDQVAFSVVSHLSSYAVGRSLSYNESRRLKEQARKLRDDGYRLQDMIRFIVRSDLFLKK